MAKYALIRNGMGNYVNGTGAKEDDLLYISNYYFYQSGVVDSGDLLVSQRAAGANMSVDVAAGRAFIANASYIINTNDTTRFWAVLSDALSNVTIAANSSGNPRIDIIVIKLNTVGSPDADASNIVTIEAVQGTPAGSPSAQATPSNCLKLAEIAVANGATSIITANITDSRQRAYIDSEKLSPISYSKVSEYGDDLTIVNNKKVQFKNAANSNSGYIKEDSSDDIIINNPDGDVIINGFNTGDTWTPYTPSLTAVTTNPTIGNGTISGAYKELPGNIINFKAYFSIGGTTTLGSGRYRLTVPVTSINDSQSVFIFNGVNYQDIVSVRYRIYGVLGANSNVMDLYIYDMTNTYPVIDTGSSDVRETVPNNWSPGSWLYIYGQYISS